MAKKLDPMDLKQIISLRLDGLSNRVISKTLGVSRNTVNQYVKLFAGCEISLKELLELDEGSLRAATSGKDNPKLFLAQTSTEGSTLII